MATVSEVTAAADAYDAQTELEKAQAANKAALNQSAANYTAYTPTTFTSATSQADSINDYYDQYIASQQEQEKASYDANLEALDYQQSKIAPEYKKQREAVASQQAIADKNFRESAAASGINTGAGSQYALASQNAYQGNITTLRQAEAEAQADVEETRRQTTASYQAAVAQALSNGNLARAQALYEEAVRVDESIVAVAQAQAQENYNSWYSSYLQQQAKTEDEATAYQQKLAKAETLASYGDFSGYYDLGYTSSQVAAMQALYKAQQYSGYSSSSGSSGSSSASAATDNYTSSYTPSGNTSNNNNSTVKSTGTGLVQSGLTQYASVKNPVLSGLSTPASTSIISKK
jgi:hypothetical protein